jgi:hypothetical protein
VRKGNNLRRRCDRRKAESMMLYGDIMVHAYYIFEVLLIEFYLKFCTSLLPFKDTSHS